MKLKYVESNHAYYLNGKRCKGVSSVAKTLDDNYSLDQWRKRMVAIGVALSDGLVERINAADQDDRQTLDDLAEEALVLAGASIAAEAGTAKHTTTEKHDRGEQHNDPVTAASWQALLTGSGLIVVSDLIERCVVWPEQLICGRFDRMARRSTDGMLATVDLKTGKSAVTYPHATVTQLTLYSNAPLLAGEMDEVEPGVFVTEEFTELPADLDREVGYMLHMPEVGDHAVYAVNLKLGLKAVNDIIFPALRWRKMAHEKLIKRVA